jgi:hypothetical protein
MQKNSVEIYADYTNLRFTRNLGLECKVFKATLSLECHTPEASGLV